MDVLRKKDRHCTSTKFRLGVIRWVHELCKRPLLLSIRQSPPPTDSPIK